MSTFVNLRCSYVGDWACGIGLHVTGMPPALTEHKIASVKCNSPMFHCEC